MGAEADVPALAAGRASEGEPGTTDLLARCQALGIAIAAGADGSLLWEAAARPKRGDADAE